MSRSLLSILAVVLPIAVACGGSPDGSNPNGAAPQQQQQGAAQTDEVSGTVAGAQFAIKGGVVLLKSSSSDGVETTSHIELLLSTAPLSCADIARSSSTMLSVSLEHFSGSGSYPIVDANGAGFTMAETDAIAGYSSFDASCKQGKVLTVKSGAVSIDTGDGHTVTGRVEANLAEGSLAGTFKAVVCPASATPMACTR